MDDVTWTIVQFIEDATVEAIPTAWIQGECCHWPPYKQEKLTSAIKKCEALNTNWPRHAIKIFRNATFDDYGKARVKARVAEDCSDLNSENEPNANGKRKIIQKILSSSSSDESMTDDAHILPPPPKLPKNAKSLNLSQSTDGNTSLDVKSFETSIGRDQGDMFYRSFHNVPCNQSTPLSKASPSTSAFVRPSETIVKPITDLTSNQIATSCCCCVQKEHSVLTEIKNQNHMMRGILIDVLRELREIKDSKAVIDTTETSLFIKYQDISFPIGTDAEMIRFEEVLNQEESFIEAVNELANFGGSKPYDFVKRALSALIKDEILAKYSWLGRKQKRIFESSPVAKLLIRAAAKCLHHTQKDVETAIQSFMKRSSERMKAKENKRM